MCEEKKACPECGDKDHQDRNNGSLITCTICLAEYTEEIELKPCPRCKGTNVIRWIGGGLSCNSDDDCLFDAGSVEIWNKRPIEDDLGKRISELKKGLDTAINALRSYKYGNQSTELAEEVVDKLLLLI